MKLTVAARPSGQMIEQMFRWSLHRWALSHLLSPRGHIVSDSWSDSRKTALWRTTERNQMLPIFHKKMRRKL